MWQLNEFTLKINVLYAQSLIHPRVERYTCLKFVFYRRLAKVFLSAFMSAGLIKLAMELCYVFSTQKFIYLYTSRRSSVTR